MKETAISVIIPL